MTCAYRGTLKLLPKGPDPCALPGTFMLWYTPWIITSPKGKMQGVGPSLFSNSSGPPHGSKLRGTACGEYCATADGVCGTGIGVGCAKTRLPLNSGIASAMQIMQRRFTFLTLETLRATAMMAAAA